MKWFEPNYSINRTVGPFFWPSSLMKNHLDINKCMNQACLGIFAWEQFSEWGDDISVWILFTDAAISEAQRGQLIYLRSET